MLLVLIWSCKGLKERDAESILVMWTVYFNVALDVWFISSVWCRKCLAGKIEHSVIDDEGKVTYPLVRTPDPFPRICLNIIAHACTIMFVWKAICVVACHIWNYWQFFFDFSEVDSWDPDSWLISVNKNEFGVRFPYRLVVEEHVSKVKRPNWVRLDVCERGRLGQSEVPSLQSSVVSQVMISEDQSRSVVQVSVPQCNLPSIDPV